MANVGSTAQSASGANNATGSQTTNTGSGNSQLQQAFQDAIAQAQQTLSISTTGQANLNALRARPQ